MPTSGALSTSNQYIKYTISIDPGAQNTATNSTRVTVSVRFYRTNTGYTTYGTGTVYCTINGTKYSASVTPSQKITSSGIVLFSKTLDIDHDVSGNTIDVSAYINHQQVTSNPQSFSLVIKAIDTASTFGTISGNTIGGSMTVNIKRATSTYTHGLWYKVGNSGWQSVASSGITTSKTFTISKSMCSQLPNSTSGTLTLLLKTFSGSRQVGSRQKTVTVNVPSDVKPSLSIAISDASGHAATYGGYIVGLSKVKVALTGTASYGSSLVSYSSKLDGTTYSGASFTSNILKNPGSITITSSVKDRRGRYGSASKSLTALVYNYPRLTKLTISRCQQNGVDDQNGNYAKVKFSYIISALNNKNKVTATLQYRQSGTVNYTTVDLTTDLNNIYEGVDREAIFMADPSASYEIILSLGDNFKTIDRMTSVSTAFTLLHFHESGTGFGVGKIVESPNLFDVGLPTDFNNDVYGNVVGMNRLPEIPENSDFNNYRTTGCWAVYRNVTAETIANIPIKKAGRLEVWSSVGTGVPMTGWAYIRQRFVPYEDTIGAVWERDITRGGDNIATFKPWWRSTLSPEASNFVYGSHNYEPAHVTKYLWSGAYYMTEGHVLDLSANNIQKQPHGIMLVFSRYNSNGAVNQNFNTFFISKKHIADHEGHGMEFLMSNNTFSLVCCKYLYITSTQIKGHANNAASGTGTSGIKYDNKSYVLRAVIGV